MKHISHYILAACCIGTLFTACQQEEDIATPESGLKALTLSAESISDRQEAATRANGNTFFANGNQIKLLITTPTNGNGTSDETKIYAYNKDVFSGKDEANKFYFQMNDDYYISKLVAQWPVGRADKPMDGNGINIPTDQHLLEDYRKADWLTANVEVNAGSTEDIMPTDAPVPLHFERNNARLEFEVQGQHAYGQKISSLILELQLKEKSDASTTKATAFWAYCNDETGHAEVILPGGSALTTPSTDYMIGRIAIGGTNEYTGTVIMPEQLNITLKPNTSYKVTLIPHGDNLIASIHIGGFGQDEEGIGLPFQLPTSIAEGVYGINNPSQLMTLSYILREYKVGTSSDSEIESDKNVEAIDWKNQKYKLIQDIVIPTDLTWKPVTKETELPEANFNLNNHTIKQNESPISFFKQ